MIFSIRFFLLFLFLSASACAGDLGDRLSSLLSNQSRASVAEILDPDIAFRVDIAQYSDDHLILSWDIEPAYYLYKDKISVRPRDQSIDIQNFNLPQGRLKQDPLFGEVEIYDTPGNVLIPFSRVSTGLETATLELAYQGCKADSVCYPPIKKAVLVSIDTADTINKGGADAVQAPLLSEQDSITQKLKDKGLLINIISFLGFGFLLALTPCVFPMIPILAGIIVGEGENINRTRAVLLSLAYVIAMALTYAIFGLIAGLFNLNLQAASQNIWVLGSFSIVFIFLALSLFGFFELQLPSSWQSKLLADQRGAAKGTLKGAVVMGVLSAIIVGPCVAPPLAGALLYISQTGDGLLGGLALFAMGLGFGMPLLLVGATSGELLPRASAWMETIKHLFGVIMLGVAIWFMERVLPEPIVLLLWAILFVTTAVFMGALDRLGSATSHWQRLWKGLGLVLMVYGIVLIVAAANGSGTVLRPLNYNLTASVTHQQSLPFNPVASVEGLEQQLQAAVQQGKPVMLNFRADWCLDCERMETYTFSDASVQAELQNFILLEADVTNNSKPDRALLKQFDLFGPPAVLFFNAEANEIRSRRLVGFMDAEPFIQHIRRAVSP